MAMMAPPYSVSVDVDPPAAQNRLSVLLRIIFAIPALFVAGIVFLVAEILSLITWIIILVTGSFPAGMHRFTGGSLRWYMRALGYGLLLTDRYPAFSTDDDRSYPIRVNGDDEIDNRNRLTTILPIRYLLAIPHLIIVTVLGYAAGVVVLISWVAALFTGSVPQGMHDFLAGYLRWNTRTYGYVLNLTDKYPPFTLK